MKTARFALATLGVVAAGLLAFNVMIAGSVKGTVVPPEGAAKAWAMSATDTFSTDISGGAFEISGVKPGAYKIVIEAKAPYKNSAKENVNVKEGEPTDIGEIKLEQ